MGVCRKDRNDRDRFCGGDLSHLAGQVPSLPSLPPPERVSARLGQESTKSLSQGLGENGMEAGHQILRSDANFTNMIGFLGFPEAIHGFLRTVASTMSAQRCFLCRFPPLTPNSAGLGWLWILHFNRYVYESEAGVPGPYLEAPIHRLPLRAHGHGQLDKV